MVVKKLTSHGEKETIRLGQKIAALLRPGDIVCLDGDLGSGKTTFVKGLAKGLKVDLEKVHSPTFVLMNIYKGRLPLFHFDLYRIDGAEELFNIGYEEFFYGQGVSVVEWAEKLKTLYPKESLELKFLHDKETKRKITIRGQGSRCAKIVGRIKGA